MKIKEYLELLSSSKVDEKKIALTEKKYNVNLPEEAKRELSAITKFTSIEGAEMNVFPLDYINDFSYKDFGIDFNVLRLIPVIDLFDACYACYDIETLKWVIYCIPDNLKFKAATSLKELIEQIRD